MDKLGRVAWWVNALQLESEVSRFKPHPLGARSVLGTQPRYEAPDDCRVKIVKNAVINIELVMTQSWPWGSQIAVKKIFHQVETQLQAYCLF